MVTQVPKAEYRRADQTKYPGITTTIVKIENLSSPDNCQRTVENAIRVIRWRSNPTASSREWVTKS